MAFSKRPLLMIKNYIKHLMVDKTILYQNIKSQIIFFNQSKDKIVVLDLLNTLRITHVLLLNRMYFLNLSQ